MDPKCEELVPPVTARSGTEFESSQFDCDENQGNLLRGIAQSSKQRYLEPHFQYEFAILGIFGQLGLHRKKSFHTYATFDVSMGQKISLN